MLGTSAAYFYSLFTLIVSVFNPDPDMPPFVFFDTSTMLIMFVSLGRYLENSAKGKTSAALTDLMALAPSMANIYTDATCSQEKKIPDGTSTDWRYRQGRTRRQGSSRRSGCAGYVKHRRECHYW